MDDSEQSNTMLKALRRIGARLALDDFGTGYSSLAYLHKYVFDKIKIDSSFVRNIEDNRTARAIVNAVVSLARTLEVETVAEGVETASQLDQVRELGCAAVQGFFLSMPIPAAGTGRVARIRASSFPPNARRCSGSRAKRHDASDRRVCAPASRPIILS